MPTSRIVRPAPRVRWRSPAGTPGPRRPGRSRAPGSRASTNADPRWPGHVDRDRARPTTKAGEQAQRREAMPGVEVAIAEVGQEAEESLPRRSEEEPPRPRLPMLQREFRQPEVDQADRDERPPKETWSWIMKWTSAPVPRAEIRRGHAQELFVVGQEAAGRGEEEGEEPRESQEEAVNARRDDRRRGTRTRTLYRRPRR